MTVKKGKHTKEEGPLKSLLLGIGGFTFFAGVAACFADQSLSGVPVAAVGGVIIWLGSLMPDKNVVKW